MCSVIEYAGDCWGMLVIAQTHVPSPPIGPLAQGLGLDHELGLQLCLKLELAWPQAQPVASVCPGPAATPATHWEGA